MSVSPQGSGTRRARPGAARRVKGFGVSAQAERRETAAPAAALPARKPRRDSAGVNVDFMCLSHLNLAVGCAIGARTARLDASVSASVAGRQSAARPFGACQPSDQMRVRGGKGSGGACSPRGNVMPRGHSCIGMAIANCAAAIPFTMAKNGAVQIRSQLAVASLSPPSGQP